LCVIIFLINKEFEMTATTNKVRTDVYLDATTKEKAQEIFK
jgi:DNA-damage-inducible protein J